MSIGATDTVEKCLCTKISHKLRRHMSIGELAEGRVGMGWGVVVLSFHLLPLSADCSERGRAAIYHLRIIGRDNVTGEGTQLFSIEAGVMCKRSRLDV